MFARGQSPLQSPSANNYGQQVIGLDQKGTEMEQESNQIYVSIHPLIKEKDGANLSGSGWKNISLTSQELMDWIKSGGPYCPWVKDGVRTDKNFEGTNIVCVDVDEGMSIEDAVHHEVSVKGLHILYTTAKHSPEAPRFRLIFKLPEVIENSEKYKRIQGALQHIFQGDRAVVHPSGFFFGNSKAKFQKWDNKFSNEDIERLLELVVPPKPDTLGVNSVNTTQRSKVRLSPDTQIKTSNGEFMRFSELLNRTPVHCPFHPDKSPSAFVMVLKDKGRFIHCSSCDMSWWQERKAGSFVDESQFPDFVETVREIKDADRNRLKKIIKNIPTEIDISDWEDPNIHFHRDVHFKLERLKPGLTFIRSPKGTGKTESLIQIILDKTVVPMPATLDRFFNPITDKEFREIQISKKTDFRVLLIGHRRSLIRNLCERLNLNCYLDAITSKVSDPKNRYGVCIDSLYKIQSQTKPYDLIILDESEQVLAHFLSSTLSNASNVFDLFSSAIRTTTSVVALDADLGWTTYLTLSSMRSRTKLPVIDEPANIYVNELVASKGPYELHASKVGLIQDLSQQIKDGKKIFVASNSRNFIEQQHLLIKDMYPETSNFYITSTNSGKDEIQYFIQNIKSEIKKYDVVLASPTLGTGVDITFDGNAKYFDIVYGFFEARVNSHWEIDQQLSRVRHPKEVKLWVSPETFNFETVFESVKYDLLGTHVVANTMMEAERILTNSYIEEENDFLRMAAMIVSNHRISKNNLKTNLIEYRQSTGWEVTHVEAPFDLSYGSKLIKHAKSLSEAEYRRQILSAKPIPEYVFERLENSLEAKRRLGDEDYFSFQRMLLELFYCCEVNNEILDMDERWLLRRQFKLYRDIFDSAHREMIFSIYRTQDKNELWKKLALLKIKPSRAPLLWEILCSTPFFNGSEFLIDVEYTSNDLENFVKKVELLKPAIETQFNEFKIRSDFRSKPVQQLGEFLKLVGLSNKTKYIEELNGSRVSVMVLNPDRLKRLKYLESLIPERNLQWRSIHERYGFEPIDHPFGITN